MKKPSYLTDDDVAALNAVALWMADLPDAMYTVTHFADPEYFHCRLQWSDNPPDECNSCAADGDTRAQAIQTALKAWNEAQDKRRAEEKLRRECLAVLDGVRSGKTLMGVDYGKDYTAITKMEKREDGSYAVTSSELHPTELVGARAEQVITDDPVYAPGFTDPVPQCRCVTERIKPFEVGDPVRCIDGWLGVIASVDHNINDGDKPADRRFYQCVPHANSHDQRTRILSERELELRVPGSDGYIWPTANAPREWRPLRRENWDWRKMGQVPDERLPLPRCIPVPLSEGIYTDEDLKEMLKPTGPMQIYNGDEQLEDAKIFTVGNDYQLEEIKRPPMGPPAETMTCDEALVDAISRAEQELGTRLPAGDVATLLPLIHTLMSVTAQTKATLEDIAPTHFLPNDDDTPFMKVGKRAIAIACDHVRSGRLGPGHHDQEGSEPCAPKMKKTIRSPSRHSLPRKTTSR
jgi:hypothetical protein